jgi:hypothetical protein
MPSASPTVEPTLTRLTVLAAAGPGEAGEELAGVIAVRDEACPGCPLVAEQPASIANIATYQAIAFMLMYFKCFTPVLIRPPEMIG